MIVGSIKKAFFNQRLARAALHAGPATDAVGLEKRLVLARHHLGLEAAPLQRQRERALDLFTGAHAAAADDALGRVEHEVGVGLIDRGLGVAGTGRPIGVAVHPDLLQRLVKLAPAALHLVGRKVGQIQLQHAPAQRLQLGRGGAHHHARFDRGGATGRIAALAVDLDQADPATAKGFERVAGAQLGHLAPGLGGRQQHRAAGGYRHRHPVDLQRHRRAVAWRRAIVDIGFELTQFTPHQMSPWLGRDGAGRNRPGRAGSPNAPGTGSCHPARTKRRAP